MFNSPARHTPRRSMRPSQRGDGTASVSRATSVFSNLDAPLTPSMPNRTGGPLQKLAQSRATVVGTLGPSQRSTSPVSSIGGDTIRSTMTGAAVREREDGWEREKAVWSRDDRHCVISAGALPSEVQSLVKGADFIVNSVAGEIDPSSGFALVSTPTVCVAWNYAKRTHSSPTCYAFPPPRPTRSHLSSMPPPLAAFFAGSSSEPGLILVSASGEVRFWESMSLALANAERYQILDIDLGDDYADKLWKIDASTFVITTTSSSAFRLTITPSGGRLVPTVQPFTRSGGMFGRATTTIFNAREDRHGVAAVTPNPGGVYLLSRRTLQRWSFGADGAIRFLQEFDLVESIGPNLFDDETTWQSGNFSVEINDLVNVKTNELGALVSYTQQNSSSGLQRSANLHAIVVFEFNTSTNTVIINGVTRVSYQAHPDPRMLDVPRLYVPSGSETAFVRFADAIVMTSILSDGGQGSYEDTITLKDSAHNAFIGVGCSTGPASVTTKRSPSLIAMPALGGLMSIEVLEGGQEQTLSAQASATARLKTKMEQAVFFGDRSDNPLTFDLQPGFKGNFPEAAEAVSAEIVSSKSPYIPVVFEVRPQLMDRLTRLKELMLFIRRNGTLSLLPQRTRMKLSRDGEVIKSAIELWDYQNRLMDHIHSRSPQSLLADSISLLVDQLGIGVEEDVIRFFFRTQIQRLDMLLQIVFTTFQSAASQSEDKTHWVLEANRIFIIVMRTASQFREDEVDIYQIDRTKPVEEPWTASDSIVNQLEELYSATQNLIQERTRNLGSVIDETPSQSSSGLLRSQQMDQALLKRQMTELAAALCSNMEDKLRASAKRQLDGGADPNEGLALHEQWNALKPRVIRPLVEIDRVAEAYELAEHHSDFSTLVYLCHHPAASSGPGKIQSYIERYGAEFAFVLYQWYIDNGHLHTLLSQDEVYGSLLTSFFETHEYPELAWMHHIANKRYAEAAASLISVDGVVSELSQKLLVSSIGKLSAVADIKFKGDTPMRKQFLNQIDDELDLIGVQNALRENIVNLAPKIGYPPAPSIDQYITSHARTIQARRPAFISLFTNLVKKLVDHGQALDIEDLIDVLTLKDNATNDESTDAAVALDRLARDMMLPEGRRQVALLSIWRRVYIRDDWAMIANTSGRSEEAQRQLQRQTLTYSTLRSISDLDDFPREYILSPFTVTQAPLPAELAARFPDLNANDISNLLVDHEDEITVLRGLIEGCSLEDRVREVGELVRSDLA